MAHIDGKLLSHLFKLARIEEEQNPTRREKLISDLSKILDYFVQLQSVDTDGITPLSGGTQEVNVWRDDAVLKEISNNVETLRDAFPEKEHTHLRVPPVFE